MLMKAKSRVDSDSKTNFEDCLKHWKFFPVAMWVYFDPSTDIEDCSLLVHFSVLSHRKDLNPYIYCLCISEYHHFNIIWPLDGSNRIRPLVRRARDLASCSHQAWAWAYWEADWAHPPCRLLVCASCRVSAWCRHRLGSSRRAHVSDRIVRQQLFHRKCHCLPSRTFWFRRVGFRHGTTTGHCIWNSRGRHRQCPAVGPCQKVALVAVVGPFGSSLLSCCRFGC